MAKIVFVLGAGFSKSAGFPVQSEILSLVTDSLFVGGSDILSDAGPPTAEFREQRRKLVEFLNQSFLSRDQRLEDIFTLLDQAISNRATFGGYSLTQLIELRDTWIRAILFCLHKCSERHLAKPASDYVRFAAWLIRKRLEAGIGGDPVSVLCLNWDSLVEDSVFHVLRQVHGLRRVDIDYTVYTTPLSSNSAVCPHTPSPKQKAAGIFNLKLLKLHGSTTWLRCPNSGLVYTALGMKACASELYVTPRPSPFMDAHRATASGSAPLLEPYIITPTFSKVFDLPHIQTTWHNAFVELREASQVIFVGYSLPDADYHLRVLLIRAIRPGTNIRVILSPSDDPDAYSSTLERDTLPHGRYQRLFGDRVIYGYNGVEALIHELAPGEMRPYYQWMREKMRCVAPKGRSDHRIVKGKGAAARTARGT
jgi:hypothetical protein